MPFALSSDELYAKSAYSSDTPADNTAAVQTITPATGEIAVLDWFEYSYDGVPVESALVTVKIGSTTVFNHVLDATVDAAVGTQIIGPFVGAVDEVIVVTIPAAGANDKCTLNIKYRNNAVIT